MSSNSDLSIAEAEYTQRRNDELTEYGTLRYPNGFHTTMTISKYREMYNGKLDKGACDTTTTVSLAGRIVNIRASGKHIVFLDISGSNCRQQIFVHSASYMGVSSISTFTTVNTMPSIPFADIRKIVRNFDIVGVEGHPYCTKSGEFSISATSIYLLAPCMMRTPDFSTGLLDVNTRFQRRYLDMLYNPHVKQCIIMRDRVTKFIQRYLDTRGFVQVDTPIMSTHLGGAAAKPFITHHNEMHMDMFLRIAPELYLKQLVIGGLERVYEIGKQFRNEGIDRTHNPEFTTCEFYIAYEDYATTMCMTEELLSSMALELTGSTEIKYTNESDSGKSDVIINFAPPFKRIDIMPFLENKLNVQLPHDVNDPWYEQQMRNVLMEVLKEHHVVLQPPHTLARMMDKLISEFIEPTCIQPTFLMNHPQFMSPLAKTHCTRPDVAERFELFVNGKELCNSYTELNDPVIQRHMFAQQMQERTEGDDEAPAPDEDFCRALDYGLPPTAGWGMGVDRLVMLLTNQSSIREVLTFPIIKT